MNICSKFRGRWAVHEGIPSNPWWEGAKPSRHSVPSQPSTHGAVVEVEVDPDLRESGGELGEQMFTDEQHGLPQVPDALSLHKPRIAVLSAVPPPHMAVDESVQLCALRGVPAIDVPRDDKPGDGAARLPRTEPPQGRSPTLRVRSRRSLNICSKACPNIDRTSHTCSKAPRGLALSPGGM